MKGKHERIPDKHPATAWWRWLVALLTTAVLVGGGVAVWQSGLIALPQWQGGGDTPANATTATTTTTRPATTTTAPSPKPTEPSPPPVYARPAEMRGVWFTAGVEYDPAAADPAAEIDTAMSALSDWTWNTVLVPVTEECMYAPFDAVAHIIKNARERKLFVYLVLDCGVMTENGISAESHADRNYLCAVARQLAQRYDVDGFLLGGYAYRYGDKPQGETEVNRLVTETVAAIKSVDRNLFVGLLTESVWAHASVREEGSKTANVYEELTDGGADTRALILDGAVDFVMVKNYRPTGDYSAAFGTVLGWWASLCDTADIPLYMAHSAQNAAANARGWTMEDQLARQVLACQSVSAWQGSAVDSIAALQKISTAAAAMKQAFDGGLMEEYITRTLTVTSPEKTEMVTNESTISIRGSADPNFAVTLNGKPLSLTDHGYFSLDATLKPGKNTFVFENKGVTVTYTVTYKVQVLKSVSPAKALALDGGATVTFSAVAHKDSTVYATISGTKVPMTQVAVQDDEGTVEDTDYVTYAGRYTLPAGLKGETRELGAVTVTGSYAGQTQSMTGGKITVNALPKDDVNEEFDVGLPDLTPIDPSKGGAPLANGTVLIVTTDYAETFSGSTTDDYSRPENAYLPKGTTDILAGTAYDASSGNRYYLLGCGRRVYQEDVKTYITGGTLAANTLTTEGVAVTGSATSITFAANWRVPFQLQTLPQKYGNPNRQDYTSATQTTEYVEITFYYTPTSVGTPDVSQSPLFSRAEWVNGAENTRVLRLYLTKAAQYYGYGVQWDDRGRITFTFKHPTYVAGNDPEQPLKGFKVVLDPGHGGHSYGTSGGGVPEKRLVLTYAELIRDKLEALGATVIMTRESDKDLSLFERTQITRASGADLFISVHMNGSTYATKDGCSVHYFSDQSIDLARIMCDNMKAVYEQYKGEADGKVVWSPFYVCRVSEMPSLLLECGYMTNAEDLERLISPDFQDALTNSVVKAVAEYAKKLPNI